MNRAIGAATRRMTATARGQHAEQQREHRRLPPLRHVEPDHHLQQHQRGHRQRHTPSNRATTRPPRDQPPRARRGHLRAHVRLRGCRYRVTSEPARDEQHQAGGGQGGQHRRVEQPPLTSRARRRRSPRARRPARPPAAAAATGSPRPGCEQHRDRPAAAAVRPPHLPATAGELVAHRGQRSGRCRRATRAPRPGRRPGPPRT